MVGGRTKSLWEESPYDFGPNEISKERGMDGLGEKFGPSATKECPALRQKWNKLIGRLFGKRKRDLTIDTGWLLFLPASKNKTSRNF